MQYGLLWLAVSGGVLKTIFHSYVSRKYVKTILDAHLFTAALFALMAVIVAPVLANRLTAPSLYTVMLSVLYGAISALFQILYAREISTGPASIAVLINAFSNVIPILVGIIFWNEDLSVEKGAGILLLFLSLYMLANPRKSSAVHMKWFLMCLTTFAIAGMVSIIQKVHQMGPHRDDLPAFLVISFIVSFAVSAAMVLHGRFVRGERPTLRITRGCAIPTVLCAVSLSVYQVFTLHLSGVMDSSVLYPILSGGIMVFSVLFTALLFRDPVTRMQRQGMVTGAISVLLISRVFSAVVRMIG
ncbi:MAG: hypothetical protein ACOX7W_02755 [Christensenellales bacterium]|jgi:drug/metabolite transporter (DMT)-like permease